ncbi:MAG: sialate O-acetylesterase [Planctomycetaceae bacterium]|nr:sialate O-acetylesterase [Planctomycetaceae bacterium]
MKPEAAHNTDGQQTVKVFILAGQSNMGGAGNVAELFEQQRKIPPSIRLWEGGQFRELVWNKSFGPEVGFADGLLKAGVAGPVVLVKLGPGGTHLYGDWAPDGKADANGRGGLYAKLMAEVAAATQAIEAQGKHARIAGMCWMQGERDARDKVMGESYRANLKAFVARLRKDTAVADMPVVIARISPRKIVVDLGPAFQVQPYRQAVREAQEKVARDDGRAAWIDADDLPQFDNLHYDAAGQLMLGRRFASAMLKLMGVSGWDKIVP